MPHIKHIHITPKRAFYFLMLLSLIGFIVMLMLYKSEAFRNILFNDIGDTFMDYFNSMNTYSTNSRAMLFSDGNFYPPLATLFYYLQFRLIAPSMQTVDSSTLRLIQDALFPFAIIFAFSIAVFLILTLRIKKGSSLEKYAFAFLMLSTSVFMFQIERFNIIFQSFLALMVYFALIDHPKAWVRELAILALAVSAALKIYPALFGIPLLIKRNKGQAIRAIILGVVCTFLPFVFFGGINLQSMFHSFSGFSETVNNQGFGYRVDFASTINCIYSILSGSMHVTSRISTIISFGFGLLLLIGAFSLKSWKQTACISLLCIGLPSVSYCYTLLFLIIPLISYLDSSDASSGRLGWIYAVIFVGIFAPLPYGPQQLFSDILLGYRPVTLGGLIQRTAVLLLASTLSCDIIYQWFTKKRLRNDMQIH